MLNYCALPHASSLLRDEGAYLDPEATGIPLRKMRNLLAFKKRIITICIRFGSLPKPVVCCKSIPGVATDMQQGTLVAHVIGLNALHRHLVVCGSHERSIHSSKYADLIQYHGHILPKQVTAKLTNFHPHCSLPPTGDSSVVFCVL